MTLVYDPTASLANNYILAEVHTPITEPDVIPVNAPIYETDFVVTGIKASDGTTTPLSLYVDYMWSPLFATRSAQTGRDVYSYIILQDYSKWTTITITYRGVGGDPDNVLLGQIIQAGAFDRTNIDNWLSFEGEIAALNVTGVDYSLKNTGVAYLFASKMDAIALALRAPSSYVSFINGTFAALQADVAGLHAQIQLWTTEFSSSGIFSGNLITAAYVAAAVAAEAGVVTTALTGYVTKVSLGQYPGHAGSPAPGILDNYVLISALTTQINNAITAALGSLSSSLTGYVTGSAMATALSGYVTNSALATALSAYELISSLNATLTGYVTLSGLSAYETIADVLLKLAGYVTTGSLATTLSGYVLASDLSLALGNYCTTTYMQTYVTNAINAATAAGGRIILTSNLTLYVSTTGSDSNNGLTSGTAFLTKQKAWNTLIANYDLAGYQATIQCAAGTYYDVLNASGTPVGLYDPAKLVINGVAPTSQSSVYANLPQALVNTSSVILPDGRIFVLGLNVNQQSVVYAGTVSSGVITWVACTAMPVNLAHQATALLSDGRVLVTGSIVGVGTSYSYFGTISGNSINWVVGTALPVGLTGHAMLSVSSTRVMVIGGTNGSTIGATIYFGTISGNTITWVAGTSYPTPVTNAGATLLVDGRVVITGGTTTGGTPIATTYFGTITTNTIAWASGTALPAAAPAVITQLNDNRLLATVSVSPYNVVYFGTIAANVITWVVGTNLPLAIVGHSLAKNAAGNVLLLGGTTGSGNGYGSGSTSIIMNITNSSAVISYTQQTHLAGNVIFDNGSIGDTITATNCKFTIQNVSLSATTNYSNLTLSYNAMVVQGAGVIYKGITSGNNINVSDNSMLLIANDYTVESQAVSHYNILAGGYIRVSPALGISTINVNIVGSPILTSAFAAVNAGTLAFSDYITPTFTGTVNGNRYQLLNNATITTGGAGATYLPGSNNGTQNTAPGNFYG